MSIDIQTLITNMQSAAEHDLTEVVLTIDGTRITIKRSAKPLAGPSASAIPSQTAGTTPTDAEDIITAPMSGLCHLRPEAEAAPFVNAGDTVTCGQTILIIEAMKVMTPLPAPRDGIVDAILIDDGANVDTDTPLLRLRR